MTAGRLGRANPKADGLQPKAFVLKPVTSSLKPKWGAKYVELRTIPITDLRAADYNPRVELSPGMPGYERLRRSIVEFGLVQPIVWNERTGNVVGGHQRLAVLRNEGREMVEVVVVSMEEAREKALNVALNNSQVGGEWDPDKLLSLVQDLHELPDFDETLTGFDANDLRDLLLQPDPQWWPESAADNSQGMVRVTLEIAEDAWAAVQVDVDRLVNQWGLRVHVRS